MKFLVINELTQKTVTIELDFCPRIGDSIPLFYQPFPKIEDVIVILDNSLLNETKSFNILPPDILNYSAILLT